MHSPTKLLGDTALPSPVSVFCYPHCFLYVNGSESGIQPHPHLRCNPSALARWSRVGFWTLTSSEPWGSAQSCHAARGASGGASASAADGYLLLCLPATCLALPSSRHLLVCLFSMNLCQSLDNPCRKPGKRASTAFFLTLTPRDPPGL